MKTCPRCKIELKKGIGYGYDGKTSTCFSRGDAILGECLKCPKCGHSEGVSRLRCPACWSHPICWGNGEASCIDPSCSLHYLRFEPWVWERLKVEVIP